MIPAPTVMLTMAGRGFYILFPYQDFFRLFFLFSFHDLSILYLSSLSNKFFNKFWKFTLAIELFCPAALAATKKEKIIKIAVSRFPVRVYVEAGGAALP